MGGGAVEIDPMLLKSPRQFKNIQTCLVSKTRGAPEGRVCVLRNTALKTQIGVGVPKINEWTVDPP
jgi:hypothetical protein